MKVEQTNFVTHLIITALPDPHLEIRWGRSSRPLDKGEGGAVSKKLFFALRDSVRSKNKGGVGPRAPPMDLPLYNTIILLIIKEPVCSNLVK